MRFGCKIRINSLHRIQCVANKQTSKRYVKSENRFHAQHMLPRAVNKIINDHVATIYEAYQADIDLSLKGFRREVDRWRTRWPLQNGMICQQHFVSYCKSSSLSFYRYNFMCFVDHANRKRYCEKVIQCTVTFENLCQVDY